MPLPLCNRCFVLGLLLPRPDFLAPVPARKAPKMPTRPESCRNRQDLGPGDTGQEATNHSSNEEKAAREGSCEQRIWLP